MNKHFDSRHTTGEANLHISSDIMRALAHPLRMKMLAFIDSKESACVQDIYDALQLEQSIASQHLRILRMAGLVHSKRSQKFIFYSLNYPRLEKAVQVAGILHTFTNNK
jgi:DNA-binding transcriptional ArsR family regulator